MPTVTITHERADRFSINVRGHVLYVDQPVDDGGDDSAPTPTELFVASLASCVAFYARRYLQRHDLSEEGLSVSAEADLGSAPARVATMRVTVNLPAGVPEAKQGALLAVASHCTVHNTLTNPPEVVVQLG
jgi:putative redox protein